MTDKLLNVQWFRESDSQAGHLQFPHPDAPTSTLLSGFQLVGQRSEGRKVRTLQAHIMELLSTVPVTVPRHTDNAPPLLIQNATASLVAFPPPHPCFPEESINSPLISQIESVTSCKGRTDIPCVFSTGSAHHLCSDTTLQALPMDRSIPITSMYRVCINCATHRCCIYGYLL